MSFIDGEVLERGLQKWESEVVIGLDGLDEDVATFIGTSFGSADDVKVEKDSEGNIELIGDKVYIRIRKDVAEKIARLIQ